MGLRLFGEVSLNAKGFEDGIKRLGSAAVAPLRNMLVGAFSIAALDRLTRSTIEWAGQLRDVADQLGVNVEWLQKMQNGAKLAGGSIEDLSKFIGQIGKSREEAARDPSGKDAAAFRRLGFNGSDITQLSPQAFIDKLVKAFSGGVTGQAVNDLQAVGGKSARNLVAAFSAQFESDAPILAEDMIDQLDEVGDRFTEIGTQLKVGLAPVLIFVANQISKFVNFIRAIGRRIGMELGMDPEVNAARDEFTAATIAAPFTGDTDRARKAAERLKKLMEPYEAELMKMGEEDAKAAEERQKGRDAQRAARRQRETSAPGFEAIDIKPVKTGRTSDALVSVGNFLGSTGRGIQAIEQRKIDLLGQIAGNTKAMALNMRTATPDRVSFPV